MSGDEEEVGEHLFNAPLPPHERNWLHPSEHARRHNNDQSPPIDRSTARTLATFAVATSLVASIGMVIVAVPGNPATTPDIPQATGVSLLVQAPVPPVSPVVSPIAAAVSESGILVTVLDDAHVGQAVHVTTPENDEFDAVVVDVEPDLGISLLKLVDGPSNAARIAVTNLAEEEIAPGSPIWVSTMTFGVELSHISSSTSGYAGKTIPIEPFTASHHGGTVFTGDGELLGWCVERDGRHWLVPANVARSAVLRLDGDVVQP